MDQIHQLLKQYWGYSEFRPLQVDVIHSVLKGEDTIALMPTGGGKSICYQIPGLTKEGICLVISPLLALMQDQTDQLNKKGIYSIALNSNLNSKEIDIALDNCIYGKVKFLYISPERIAQRLFQERVQKMNINLIAVDEAHCISQWGFDFRPAYLEIAKLRDFFQKTPLLALTATATKPVLEDIKKHLGIEKAVVYKKSFYRPNLAYQVFRDEDKINRLLSICKSIDGSGLVYVRNRRKTKEITEILLQQGLNAVAYHAGLPNDYRTGIQKKWMTHPKQIIVCTNAFGMGIDKSDVRFVIHFDAPESLEAYFQEAGRAGRDEKFSLAALLFHSSDAKILEEFVQLNFPSLPEIRHIYQCICNHYQLAIVSGEGVSFTFNNADFSDKYSIHPLKSYNTLKLLEKEGFVKLSEYSQGTRIQFSVGRNELYNFQVSHPNLDNFIKLLLRNYGGLFDNSVRINERDLAYKSGLNEEKIKQLLAYLDKSGLLIYQPATEDPQLIFLTPRIDAQSVVFTHYNLKVRREIANSKMQNVVDYAMDRNHCRSQLLLSYFGESFSANCGICDYCKTNEDEGLTTVEFDQVAAAIKSVLFQQPLDFNSMNKKMPEVLEKKLRKTIEVLTNMGLLKKNENNEFEWI